MGASVAQATHRHFSASLSSSQLTSLTTQNGDALLCVCLLFVCPLSCLGPPLLLCFSPLCSLVRVCCLAVVLSVCLCPVWSVFCTLSSPRAFFAVLLLPALLPCLRLLSGCCFVCCRSGLWTLCCLFLYLLFCLLSCLLSVVCPTLREQCLVRSTCVGGGSRSAILSLESFFLRQRWGAGRVGRSPCTRQI